MTAKRVRNEEHHLKACHTPTDRVIGQIRQTPTQSPLTDGADRDVNLLYCQALELQPEAQAQAS